ncbi:hypothetical protein [Nocardioides salarius]|uniref:hypothetical protein n=1 Tax=Nocardioides salarius TaxID=374513 RepID=UPI0030F87177
MRSRTYVVLVLTAIVGLSGCANDTERTDPGKDRTIATPTSDGTPSPDDVAMPPWPAPTDVAARVSAAGLDLGPMGMAEHYHPKLRIIIDGSEVPIPPNVGVDPTTGAMSALHTHEGDGTIHIEADSVGEVFTLRQFFTQWGVALTPDQIGGVRAKPGQQVELTSNGTKVTGDPAALRLEPDQKIVLTLQ